MLVAIGPGVTALQDYTNQTNAESVNVKSAQGDTLDELTCVVHDPNSSYPISNEDDAIILDETDPNGWPTCNLVPNPSFEGTYGAYTYGTIAPNTSFFTNRTVGTLTLGSTASALYGTKATTVSWSNTDKNCEQFLYQVVQLPKDENGNPIVGQQYCASASVKVTTTCVASKVYAHIDWKTAAGVYISTSAGVANVNPGANGTWRRYAVYATPPSNAGQAFVGIDCLTDTGSVFIANPTAAPGLSQVGTGGNVGAGTWTLGYTWITPLGETQISPTAQIVTSGTTSTITMTVPALPAGATGWNLYIAAVGTSTPLFIQATSPYAGTTANITAAPTTSGHAPPGSNGANTNSGAVAIDGLQFEMMTFANYNIPASYADTFQNKIMSGTVGAGNAVNNWLKDNTSAGITYSVVSSPAIYGTAQQVVISGNATTTTTCGIKQNPAFFNMSGNYTISMQYQITGALNAATQVHFGANWHDIYTNYVSTVSYNGPTGEGLSEGWQTVTMQLGPNTANPPPSSNMGYFEIFAGIFNPFGAGGGTIVIGAIIVTPFMTNAPYTTAGALLNQGGKYPTPYCASDQAGCYVDAGYSGLPYRHLRMFGGYVRHAKYDYTMSRERWVEVDAVDYGVLLAEAPATILIRAQTDKAAIAQACQYAQNLGFLIGLDYTTFVTNIATVDAMVFNWQTTRDVLSKIANTTIASYYVDYYKRLHYQPALANSAPFGVSDNPNSAASPPTYPMSGLTIDNDSSQLLNSPVIEGSTQLSTPQTFSQTCDQTTLSVALTQNTTYTSITVAAITNAIPVGTYLTLSNTGHTQQILVTTLANASATSITVASFQANFTYPITTTTVFTSGVTMNNGSAVVQVDSLTIGGTARTVGLFSVNQFSQGYDTLLDPGAGVVYFNSTVFPANSGVAAVTYRFSFPVLVRLTNPNPPSGRKVHHHTKREEVASKQSAIDRANADLNQFQKAQAIGELIITTPPVPNGLVLTSGMAISVTHAGAGYNQTLFQIQEIDITFGGNGFIMRTLKLGFYRPDFMIHLAQTRRTVFSKASSAANDSILQDVVSVADQWAITDNITHTVTNNGKWGGVTSSTWDGTYVWG